MVAKTPHLAPSLARFREQINAAWPNRSKVSDGWIGDTTHSNRVSDHNPDSNGVVRAIDITVNGIDKQAVIDAALADPRTRYVISDGRIATRNSTDGFSWAKYTGSNPHDKHIHISSRNFPWADIDTSDWRLGTTEDVPMIMIVKLANNPTIWIGDGITRWACSDWSVVQEMQAHIRAGRLKGSPEIVTVKNLWSVGRPV